MSLSASEIVSQHDRSPDIDPVQFTSIENLLQYFLYLSMEGDSSQKKELEELMDELEKLEGGVYKLSVNQSKVPPELTELRRKRDSVLGPLLQTCLSRVLPLCGDPKLNGHLREYRSTNNSDRYAPPYIAACNHALELLDEQVSLSDLPIRHKSPVDICFRRNAPNGVGEDQADHHGPHVFITSKAAVQVTDSSNEETLAHPIDDWTLILACNELKRNIRDLEIQLHSVVEAADEEACPPPKRRKLDHPASRRSECSSRRETSSRDEATSIGGMSNDASDLISPVAGMQRYAQELMSRFGVHHAITCLVVDTKFWVVYYDRQGVIESEGFDFIEDLPYFLVLLLAFQRFNLEDWGFIPELNSKAAMKDIPDKPHLPKAISDADHQKSVKEDNKVTLNLDKIKNVTKIRSNLNEVTIDLNEYIFYSDGIEGRATSVFEAHAGELDDLVFKIYNPEVERRNEGEMIKYIYDVIDEHDPTMKKHMPEILAYGDFPGCSTNRIRSILNVDWGGHRTTRFIVLVKLNEFRTLSGENFMRAWFDVVKFHGFLWLHGIFHEVPSVRNIMCDKNGRGVLSDFDLTVSDRHPGTIATNGTGTTPTTPFMSISLLTKEYWDGKLKRLYPHELEALVWILPFVVLRYPKNGEAHHQATAERWMTSDLVNCAVWKSHFLLFADDALNKATDDNADSDWKVEWFVAYSALQWVRVYMRTLQPRPRLYGTVRKEERQQDPEVQETLASFVKHLRNSLDEPFFSYLGAALNALETLAVLEPA